MRAPSRREWLPFDGSQIRLREPEEFRELSELPKIDHPGWNLEHRNQNQAVSQAISKLILNFGANPQLEISIRWPPVRNEKCHPPGRSYSVIIGWPVRHDVPFPKPHPRAPALRWAPSYRPLRILGLIVQRDTFAELVPAHDGADPVNFERAPLKMPPRSAYLRVLVRIQVPSH